MQERPFPQERRLNRARCRAQNIADDLLELFLSVRDVHQLVETEQRRCPRLFLKEIRRSLRTPPDAMLVFIAWRADTPGVTRPSPGFCGVGPNMAKAVKNVFHSGSRWKSSSGYVPDPSIVRGSYIKNYHFIVKRTLVHEKLRKADTL